jgi:hypothetical protein
MSEEEEKQKNSNDREYKSKKEVGIIPKSDMDTNYHEDELGINDNYKNESRKLKETILMATKDFKYKTSPTTPEKIKEYVEDETFK